MITVHVTGFLTGFTGGQRDITLSGRPPTVGDALESLWKAHPGLRDRVVNELGRVRPHVNVFVNEDNIRQREALGTRLAAGDDITILPAISGGQAPAGSASRIGGRGPIQR
jgi:molybdopterin converting factor small subunit